MLPWGVTPIFKVIWLALEFMSKINFGSVKGYGKLKCLGKNQGKIRPQGYKKFSCSTQLNMKFFLLINVKMPTVVGI